MPSFGHTSEQKLKNLHPKLVLILRQAIKLYDFSVLETHRGIDEQIKLFNEGKSKVKSSKHNLSPAEAVDIAPYPIDWEDTKRFYYLAGIIKTLASENGIAIRWGGDWDSDTDFADNTFNDLPHFELR